MEEQRELALAEAIAEVARSLHAEATAQQTLQRMVDLAVDTIDGCEHAGVSIVDRGVSTPAASDDVPRRIDQIQFMTAEGPCLDGIRNEDVFRTDDLRGEDRWPAFVARTVAETGVLSLLSFRLFLEQETLGALNLYSSRRAAFGAESEVVGRVFAAHAAVALVAAREHERVAEVTERLHASRHRAARYVRQAELGAALQRELLTDLPDLSPLQAAARYIPTATGADVGGDWYDAFVLPSGTICLAVGDIAGHDIEAASAMGQARSVLRTLAVDRDEPPGQVLDRLDEVLEQLGSERTATCVFVQLTEHAGGWQASLANAGHPPPLLLARGEAHFLEPADDVLLGSGSRPNRSSVSVRLAAGDTLLLYTDGLVEGANRDVGSGLAALRSSALDLAGLPVDVLGDRLLSRLVVDPGDDVCLLAVRLPG